MIDNSPRRGARRRIRLILLFQLQITDSGLLRLQDALLLIIDCVDPHAIPRHPCDPALSVLLGSRELFEVFELNAEYRHRLAGQLLVSPANHQNELVSPIQR